MSICISKKVCSLPILTQNEKIFDKNLIINFFISQKLDSGYLLVKSSIDTTNKVQKFIVY